MRPRVRNRIVQRIRQYPVEEVSRRNRQGEVDPGEVGLSESIVSAIWSSIESLYSTRLYPAIGLCIRRHGKVFLDGAIGHLHGNAPNESPNAVRVQAQPDSLFNLFSASKAITAMVVHLLDERRLLHLDDPVAEYIPEFGANGKQWITLKHVLTHRAGIPSVPQKNVDISLLSDWPRMVQLLCETKPVAAPGRRLAYHALTGGFVIGEVVRRVTGKDIRTVLEEEILKPLGFKHLSYGVAKDEIPLVARNAFTGPPAFPPASWLIKRALGVGPAEATALSNDERFLTTIIPSGNIISTANEASRFFQMLLNGGSLDGVEIFEPRTVRRAMADQTYLEYDLTLMLPVRYGMGFMLGGERYSIYGPGTPRAFGHVGFTNVVVYADPERDISACLMTSGKPFIHHGLLKWLMVMGNIARLIPRT